MTTIGNLPSALTLTHRPGDTTWSVALTWSGLTPGTVTASLVTIGGDTIAGVTLNAATVGQVTTLTVTGTVPLGTHRWLVTESGSPRLGGDFVATIKPTVNPSTTAVTVALGGPVSVTVESIGPAGPQGDIGPTGNTGPTGPRESIARILALS